MSYEIGTHFDFSSNHSRHMSNMVSHLREVGEHIIFVVDRSTDATINVVR